MVSGLSIAREQEIELTHIHKFGENSGLSSTDFESVWSEGGLYPWSVFDAGAVTLFAVSTGADTGSIIVEGLDDNYDEQFETIPLTGTTAVALTKTFRRVHRVEYADGANAGAITVRALSGTGTIVGKIEIGKNQSQMAVYTVPRKCRGYISSITIGTGKNDDASVELHIRQPGQSFKMKTEVVVFQSTHQQILTVPLFVYPKGDIDFRAITTSANSKVVVNFDLIREE